MRRFAFVLALVATCPAPAPAATNDALWLARMCVGESGWGRLDTCAAEVGVIRRRGLLHGTQLATMARAYSSALRRPRRPWVPRLLPTGPAPRGWPAASWPRHRARFGVILEHVEGVLAGDVVDPCEDERPLHFGGPAHIDADLPDDWQVVDCVPGSRQRFWRRAPRGGAS